MHGSRNICQGGGGGGGPGTTARKQLRRFFVVFLALNLFYNFTVVYQWFISKKTMKTIIIQGFRGVQHFQGGGGGGGPTFSGGGGP